MTAFLDASALTKRYLDEPGADAVRALDDVFLVSELSFVEVRSALWRAARLGRIADHDLQTFLGLFDAEWFGADDRSGFISLPVGGAQLLSAAELVAIHDLRTGDAIQLATAVVARRVGQDCDRFVAYDARLRRAALAESFAIWPAAI